MPIFPLTTTQLILRPFRRSDLTAFTAYRNRPAVARYQSWSSYTAEDAEKFFVQQQNLPFNCDDTWFQIAIELKDHPELIGDIAVHFFDQGKQAELGITFDCAYQGHGYAHEALASVLKLLFLKLEKHRLVATVDVENLRAQNLLHKLGFRQEGHYHQNIFFKGKWSDEYSYALLHHEWQRLSQNVLTTVESI